MAANQDKSQGNSVKESVDMNSSVDEAHTESSDENSDPVVTDTSLANITEETMEGPEVSTSLANEREERMEGAEISNILSNITEEIMEDIGVSTSLANVTEETMEGNEEEVSDVNGVMDETPGTSEAPTNKIQLSDDEWNEMKTLPSVGSCIFWYKKEKVVKAIIGIMNDNGGKLPKDIKANEIADCIDDNDHSISHGQSAKSDVQFIDKGHQGGSMPHEVEVKIQCHECDKAGTTPVVKITKL